MIILILFWQLHQIHRLNNNLNDDVLWWNDVNFIIKQPFYDKNIIKLFQILYEYFFFSWIQYLWLTVTPAFVPDSFENTKPQKQLMELFCKKVFLKIFPISPENTCVEVSFFSLRTLLNRDPTLVFSREIFEIFKSTYFEEHLRTTACEICSFIGTALFDNFWLKSVPML